MPTWHADLLNPGINWASRPSEGALSCKAGLLDEVKPGLAGVSVTPLSASHAPPTGAVGGGLSQHEPEGFIEGLIGDSGLLPSER